MTPCPKCNSTMELDSSMVHRCENPECRAMADDKRDESRDVWILGNWCGQYILRHDSSDELKRSSAHYVPASDLEAAQRRVAELEAMLVPHHGETWDSDKPPLRARVFELFAALSKRGTQGETESVRGTLRTLLCNRDTLAQRVMELETTARKVVDNIPGCLCQTVEFDMYAHDLESLLTEKPADAK